MEDLGSGALIDLSMYGLPKEPIVAERIEPAPISSHSAATKFSAARKRA